LLVAYLFIAGLMEARGIRVYSGRGHGTHMDIVYQLVRASAALQRVTERLSRVAAHSADRLARDSQEFWTNPLRGAVKGASHWRGEGPFRDNDELWFELGRRHYSLFEKVVGWAGIARPLGSIVDWGAGGGMNAVHFAPIARHYFAVDINPDSLDECARQVAAAGATNVIPVHIDVAKPDAVLDTITEPVDLFLCFYVFELIPSPEYGLDLVRLAYRMLRPGGTAIIQIRYRSRLASLSKRRNYGANYVVMTTFTIEEFWSACQEIGFMPMFATLVPSQQELGEHRYAYFALRK